MLLVQESIIVGVRFNRDNNKTMTPIEQPTPDQIRAVLKKHSITREQAAGLLHVSLRAMHNWLAPKDTANHRAMPVAAWELLLIKLGEISVDKWSH